MEQNQEEKNDKQNLTKIKNFYSPKDKRMKRQVTVQKSAKSRKGLYPEYENFQKAVEEYNRIGKVGRRLEQLLHKIGSKNGQ